MELLKAGNYQKIMLCLAVKLLLLLFFILNKYLILNIKLGYYFLQ